MFDIIKTLFETNGLQKKILIAKLNLVKPKFWQK